MIPVRVVEIPKMKIVTSGPIRTEQAFEAFNSWWSAYDKTVLGKITPRDFMWYNERQKATEWFYVLPVPETDNRDYGGYAVKDFNFGLYAVASNLDADCDEAKDWMQTKAELYQYVQNSGIFDLSTPENDCCERYTMFHIISPQSFFERTGFHHQDMYVPIVYKKRPLER